MNNELKVFSNDIILKLKLEFLNSFMTEAFII